MARVLPGVQAANIREALLRVNQFLESVGRVKPTESDLQIWRFVQGCLAEANNV